MVPQLEAAGLLFVGKDETGERMEVVELQDNPVGHPFYVAAQVRSNEAGCVTAAAVSTATEAVRTPHYFVRCSRAH